MNTLMLRTCVLVEQPLVVHALPAGLHSRLPQRNLFRDVAVPVACQATLLHAVAICRGTQQELANVWVIPKHRRPLMLTLARIVDVEADKLSICRLCQSGRNETCHNEAAA